MGAGHDGAARELRRRLTARGHDVQIIDFLDLVPFRLGAALRWLYQFQLRTLPWTYELTYRLTPILRAPTVVVDDWLTRRRMGRAINEFRPAVVVSVYPLSSLVLGRMRRSRRLRVPVLTYLTDFSVHALWVDRGVDRHLAVSEVSARLATVRGARDVVARGPMVEERFRPAGEAERESMRSRLGLAPDVRAVLVVAGSWGVGEVGATVEAIARGGEFHPIVVCGRNEHLRAELEQRGRGTVIGWTADMPGLMAAADVLVENAGGLTCMEAFASGLPVVTYRPIPGHGRDNAETMAGFGVCRYAHDREGLLAALREVAHEGPSRDAMTIEARALFLQDPSRDVEELASSAAAVGLGGGPILRPWSAPRRSARAAAALVTLYAGLTLGAQGVAALGVGIAKPPVASPGAVYLGVRLDGGLLGDQRVLDALRTSGASLIVDAGAAVGRAPELAWLVDHAVDIANGGSGHSAWLRPGRARRDVGDAVRLITRETGTRPTVFAPGRRIDAFDQYYAHRTHQRLVVPRATFEPEEPSRHLTGGGVYVLDGRGAEPVALVSALARIDGDAAAAKFRIAPLRELR